MREARALRKVARAALLPGIEGSGSYARRQQSENANEIPAVEFEESDLYRLGFDAAWEIDIFGRNRNSLLAARMDEDAVAEQRRDVLMSLQAEIARNYVELRLVQEQLRIARANIAAQEQSLQLARDRFEARAAPELDLRQAEANLADTESEVPLLEANRRNLLNRLAVLTGQIPGELDDRLPTGPLPTPPDTFAIGIPTELLRRRPDLRRAERELQAQVARLDASEAQRLPTFTLSGTLGQESQDSGEMFDGESRAWSIGPAFRWSLFQGGRIRQTVKADEERVRQAELRYDQTLLVALEECENALRAWMLERDRRHILGRSVVATRRSVELARELYVAGQTDFQNLLDAQRSQLSAENRLAASEAAVLTNLIALLKALGGGWQ